MLRSVSKSDGGNKKKKKRNVKFLHKEPLGGIGPQC